MSAAVSLASIERVPSVDTKRVAAAKRQKIGVLKWRYSEARQQMRLAFKRARDCVESIRRHRAWLVKEEHPTFRESHERNILKNLHFIGIHRGEAHHHRRVLEKIVRELEAVW